MKLDSKLPYLSFDKLLLRQAFINIVKNAIEAMENKGRIEISTGIRNQSVMYVEIKDSGPGISQSDISRLFDPTFSRKETGTGLGLSIVEKIALDHKGRVYCNSVPGQGAVFTIELPMNSGGKP